MKKRFTLFFAIALIIIGLCYLKYKRYNELEHVSTIQEIFDYYEAQGLQFNGIECEVIQIGADWLRSDRLEGERFDAVMEKLGPMKIRWTEKWHGEKDFDDGISGFDLRLLKDGAAFVDFMFSSPDFLEVWDSRDSEMRMDPQGNLYYPYGKPINSFERYHLDAEISAQELYSLFFQ